MRREFCLFLVKGLSEKAAAAHAERKASEARSQGASICGHIGATEDAASRRFAAGRSPADFLDRPLIGEELVGRRARGPCVGVLELGSAARADEPLRVAEAV